MLDVETSAILKIEPQEFKTVNLVELTDDCIERIAEAVVQKLVKSEKET